jgi:signal transduction histidine kinase
MLQTLTNLLSNAIKFSTPQSLVTMTSERRGSGLLIRVRDQGRGIPTHKLQSIFERFQQVDASDSRDKGGTGLGLAICRSIVQQHGGAIWVDSIEGKGSEFFVLLPRFQPEDESVVSVPTSRDRALPT